MCKNIVLLGSGNIGIRHLEGLNKLKFKVKITVIDKSSLSLKKAKFFFNNLPKNNKINKVSFVNSMDSLVKSLVNPLGENIYRQNPGGPEVQGQVQKSKSNKISSAGRDEVQKSKSPESLDWPPSDKEVGGRSGAVGLPWLGV